MMPASPFIQRHTELSANILAFCRFLRVKGMNIGPAEVGDALEALTHISYENPKEMQEGLKAVLTRSRGQQLLFDELYIEYWKNLEKAVDSKVKHGEPEPSNKKKQKKNNRKDPVLQSIKSWLYNDDEQENEAELAVYSSDKVLTEKDFSFFQEDELQEVMELITVIARSLATKLNRRYQRLGRTGTFDLRRSMRLNMRRGGEMLDLAFRQKRIRKLKMVMLCDVSKSMDLYSQFLVNFIYAFQTVYKKIETFTFSTSLHRVTEQLQQKSFALSLQLIQDHVPDWSGGTRIGESLATFVSEYGERLVDKHTVVLIMSDGWDTGDIQLLEDSMKYLQRKSAQVVWLNPLAGNPKYETEVEGMKAAMPYIDIFAPAHNVDSLRRLVKRLRVSAI